MSEPELTQNLEVTVPKTSVEPATPSKEVQPAVVVETKPIEPDLNLKLKEFEVKLQESEAKIKRHKEQLAGKDKLIEELKIKKIVESFQPEKSAPVNEDIYAEPTVPVKPVFQPKTETDIKQSIYVNKAMMKDEFGNDPSIPFNNDTAKKVEEVLDRLDPSGKSKIHPDAWRSAYLLYKGESTEELVKQREEQVRQEFATKESAKAASYVTPVTPPTPVKVGPTVDDVLSGKVKMSAKEILTNFPELQSQVTPKLLREMGITK